MRWETDESQPECKGKKGFQNGFDIYEHMEKNKKKILKKAYLEKFKAKVKILSS